MKGRKSMGYIRVREQVAFETQEQADAFKALSPKDRGNCFLVGQSTIQTRAAQMKRLSQLHEMAIDVKAIR